MYKTSTSKTKKILLRKKKLLNGKIAYVHRLNKSIFDKMSILPKSKDSKPLP